jgi:hypothetical protein
MFSSILEARSWVRTLDHPGPDSGRHYPASRLVGRCAGVVPGLREIETRLHVGQRRATQIKAYLAAEDARMRRLATDEDGKLDFARRFLPKAVPA